MLPDRRRRGRAIRKQRRINRGTLTPSLALRADLIVKPTLEVLDMTTVHITAPTSTPADVITTLRDFALSLHNDGITTTLDVIRTCIACGCTDDHACFLGCSWINDTDDLCTNCDTPDARATAHTATQHRANRDILHTLAAEVVRDEIPDERLTEVQLDDSDTLVIGHDPASYGGFVIAKRGGDGSVTILSDHTLTTEGEND
ncbi:hypothetical protein [Microbacterium maritypicum]